MGETAFHYKLELKLVNYLNKDDVDFIEDIKEFRNDNPIEARIEAFRWYQNWVDILLTGIEKDKEYTTDRQAREDLKTYFNLNSNLKIKRFIYGNEVYSSLSDIFIFGIGVYFVIDKVFPDGFHSGNRDDALNDHVGDEDLIHGIGSSGAFTDPTHWAFNLDNELDYYRVNNYETRDYLTEASYYDHEIYNDIRNFEYLRTPFDWSGLDDPHHPLLNLKITDEITYKRIINNGEGETVEFKPSLSYHFKKRTWEGKREVNIFIAKAICGFLNSKGGLLFIGVKDNGEIQGLDSDFKLADKDNTRDWFKLEFDKVIRNFLNFSVRALVTGDFAEIDGKLIFVVTVNPCYTMPVFVKESETEKTFWIRGTASTQSEPNRDIEEIIKYWLNRKAHNEGT